MKFLKWFPHQPFAFVAAVVFVLGLLAGRAYMSVCMIILLGNALINLNVVDTFNSFRKDKISMLLVGLFFLYGISILWSENVSYYSNRMQLMLPFLALPFAFHAIHWKKIFFDYLATILIAVCVVGASWSLWFYFQDKAAIDMAYGFSKHMPTPFGGDHIRFGVLVVVGISFCFQLLKEKSLVKWPLAIAAFFLIVYLHLLASKTALLSLYLIILYELFILLRKKEYRLIGFGLLLSAFLLPLFFYNYSQSFKNKIGYTRYSIEQMFNSQSKMNTSDEGRIVSYKMSLSIIKNNLLIGVGVGDGFDAMTTAYKNENLNTAKVLYPHNQFLYMALVLGIVGLIYFLYLLFEIIKTYYKSSGWMHSFLLIFILPFLVETFLNTQFGIAVFLFFFLLLKRKEDTFSIN